MNINATGECVYVPGSSMPVGSPEGPALEPERLHELLGRKGLSTKEPSTRLALAAVHHALRLPPGTIKDPVPGAGGTAVVVASNFGNMRTVCHIAEALTSQENGWVSPMDAPNASSNIIASSIAIRYGFDGPNVMICNGPTSGFDAVRLGARLLRARRTRRVIVVGSEVRDDVTRLLAPDIISGAACVVLEADAAGHPVLGRFEDVRRRGGEPSVPAGEIVTADSVLSDVELTGDTSGAGGVMAVAAAAARTRSDGAVRVARGRTVAGVRSQVSVLPGDAKVAA